MAKKNLIFNEKNIIDIIKKVGFKKLTLLQEKALPVILKGKDLLVEIGAQKGKTLCIVLPIINSIKSPKNGIKAIVIMSQIEGIKKTTQIFKKISRIMENKFSLCALGIDDQIQKETRQLKKNPDVLIGLADRIIDHIRRGNIDLSAIKLVVIDNMEKSSNKVFEKDVFFIFSKLPTRKQIIHFYQHQENGKNNLISLMKHPVILSESEWSKAIPAIKYSYYVVEEKLELILNIILVKKIDYLLIFCKQEADGKKILTMLKNHGLRVNFLAKDAEPQQCERIFKSFSHGKINILITTFNNMTRINLEGITHIINFDLPPVIEDFKNFINPAYVGSDLRMIINFINKAQYYILDKIQEKWKVKMKQEHVPRDNEVIKGEIDRILKIIKEEADPDELNHLKKIIKRNVPLFLRTYFTAYLFKNMVKKQKTKKTGLTTLFISAGKNRRIFPRDLQQFFMNKFNLKESDIGEIKIFDSYSFIDVPDYYAKKAVREVSGAEIKGRRVLINFSRKKDHKRASGNYRY